MEIKLYQINKERDENHVMFLGMPSLATRKGRKATLIDSEIYDLVFDGEIKGDNLEDIYRVFNTDAISGDYTGRSMSVSDVVEIVSAKTIPKGFYFCDTVGFCEVNFDTTKAVPAIKKAATIKVVLCEPGKLARITEIGSSLSDMQKTVNGDIEGYYPFEEPVAIVCNEEGKFSGEKLNRAVYDENGNIADIIAGTFFICSCSGENFDSLSEEQLEKYKKKFLYPENFIQINGRIHAIRFDPENSKAKVNESANIKLYKKLSDELDRYKNLLLELPPKEILEHAYAYTIKQDIVFALEEYNLSTQQAAALLKSDHPLEDIFSGWENHEGHYMDEIRDVIEYAADEKIKGNK